MNLIIQILRLNLILLVAGMLAAAGKIITQQNHPLNSGMDILSVLLTASGWGIFYLYAFNNFGVYRCAFVKRKPD
jgi:hypothetical protein